MSFGIPTRNGLSLGLGAVPTLATNFGLPIPSLSLDYTIPSDGTPGVVPGFYQVDNGFGVLTQTTFSSLITFSRASNATRFSPTGQLQYAPHNLLLQSQTFDNAVWTKTNASITANAATAPDGTLTGDKLVEDTNTGGHTTIQNVTATDNTTYTFSVFAKAGERVWIAPTIADKAAGLNRVWFDLSTGTQGTTNGTVSAFSAINIGSGWWRISVSASVGSGASTPQVRISLGSANNTPSYTGDGTSGLFIWGAQLAVGPNALDYTPTTTAVVYGPRFDYDPTTLAAKGLLIEEQRTNSLTYSEQFDNASWSNGNTTETTNTAVAPDGTTTADTLNDGTSTATHDISQGFSITSGTTYTLSAFFKNIDRQYVILACSTGINSWASAKFDLVAGAVGATSSSGAGWSTTSSSITNVGNSWYRCTITFVPGTTALSGARLGMATDGTTFSAGLRGLESYTGTNKQIYIWGAQLEAGAFATSYIPTTTAATTRSVDIASIGTLSPWYNATEGTFFAEWTLGQDVTSVSIYTAEDGTNNNFIRTRYNAAGTSNDSAVAVGGVSQATLAASNQQTLNTTYKNAMAYKINDFARSASGAAVITDTSGTIPTVTQFSIGKTAANTEQPNGYIRRITYTPRRLTDAELQSLTS